MYNKGDIYRSDDGLDYGYVVVQDLAGEFIQAKQYLGKYIREDICTIRKEFLARRFIRVENDTARF